MTAHAVHPVLYGAQPVQVAVLGQPPGQFPGGLPVAAASPGAQDLPGPGLVTAQECLPLHGGTGFTWEHPADLYRKRAKTDSIASGTPDAYRAAPGVPGQPPPP